MRGNRMTPEELDRQTRRSYADDRLPGIGLDRNALGVTGMSRLPMPEFITTEELDRLPARDGRCRKCGERILGRPGTARMCLLHSAYGRPLTRAELVALVDEHQAVVKALRKALKTMDEEAAG